MKVFGVVLALLALGSWLFDIGPVESPERAMGACRQQWIEQLKPDFSSSTPVNVRDGQYIQACMNARGHRIISGPECASDASQVSAPECYERLFLWRRS
ncbi:hypothetical protein [Chelatococcus reniformis]|uniref:Uncharacterized protein n=1 Tax=Chelatococcus reniformis TaxID=1494448 RepID=A0A916UTX7_9HYPH|nr:hypothetical protein [Chelatococcus reniformis]GGC88262.1 hypothetical protein GCM10010994_52780 [Chelatococcus reniformis]